MVRSRIATNQSGMKENGSIDSTHCASKESLNKPCTCEHSQSTNYISLTVERFASTFQLAHKYWVQVPIYARIAALVCLFPFLVLPTIGFVFIFPLLLIVACFCYCVFFSPATFSSHVEEVYYKYGPAVKKSLKSTVDSYSNNQKVQQVSQYAVNAKQNVVQLGALLYYKLLSVLCCMFTSAVSNFKNAPAKDIVYASREIIKPTVLHSNETQLDAERDKNE